MGKRLLFSVKKDDFTWQFFRAGGRGGQKQNKTSSACRCIHPPSGAVGESREERSQAQNRKLAFRRCVATGKFQFWLKATIAATTEGYRNVEEQVNKSMSENNLSIEYFTPGED